MGNLFCTEWGTRKAETLQYLLKPTTSQTAKPHAGRSEPIKPMKGPEWNNAGFEIRKVKVKVNKVIGVNYNRKLIQIKNKF